MSPHPLHHLNTALLRRLSGAKSFQRGEDYFTRGRVGRLIEDDGAVSATVRGSETYHVKLRDDDGEVEFSCDCPMGREGQFCKHCVAVGLTWLQTGRSEKNSERQSPQVTTLAEVRSHLAKQEKAKLIELLMAQAVRDDELRRQLLLATAVASGSRPDVEAYRRVIDVAVGIDDFVDYRQTSGYLRQVNRVIDSIRELLADGYAIEVIDLAEHALAAAEAAAQSIDDSDGTMSEIMEDLQTLHHEACEQAMPDPEQLARRLFAWEMRTDWDSFFGAAENYRKILGRKGLAVYRALAEDAWRKLPLLMPGKKSRDLNDGNRFRLTQIMETLARQTGDVNALVAIKQQDLSSAYHYLQIAETYREAGKHDLALDWAEQGIKVFPERTDSRLREFLAQEYHRRGRHGEALALAWAQWSELPGLVEYKNLKQHADRDSSWPEWREKALAFIRQTLIASSRKQRDRRLWRQDADHSLLVEILLWEKDVEGAWHEAKIGGCGNALWMELAKRRESKYPADALPIYRQEAERTVDRKTNDAYAQAVNLMMKIRALMLTLGQKEAFGAYLQEVRISHKAKRNFIKLLDAKRW